MNFKNMNIKYEYRSSRDDIVKEFLIPVISNSKIYRRSVGYFTSKSLVHLTEGIDGLIKNGGKMQLVISPNLLEKDIEAIEKGYELRDKVISSALQRELLTHKTDYEKENLNKLVNLIAHGYLDIKVAVLEQQGHIGIYHEKLGILEDNFGNQISFSGSMNESHTAFYVNYETVDVFRSWVKGEQERTKDKVKAFERIWNNEENKIIVKEYPEFNKELIRKYKTSDIDIDTYKRTGKPIEIYKQENYIVKNNFPKIPEYINLYDYQEEAIANWLARDGKGIFDMATGTGKTFTALAALSKLSSSLNHDLGVIVVCPFQHLVEQWVEDIKEFNIEPIIGYSSSKQKDWEKRLERAVRKKRLGIEEDRFFCFVTTNATFSSEKVQKQVKRMSSQSLIIIDEAHNFGTESLSSRLPKHFNYRIALSATFERYMDEIGTKKLYEYFSQKVIEYTIGQAIKDGKLSRYYYNPILVSLTDDELDEYLVLSKQIGRHIKENDQGQTSLSEIGKLIAIKRSRIIAGASKKMYLLPKYIKKYKNDNHILIYCGSTNVINYIEEDRSYTAEEDIRQIDLVSKILGNELDMRISQFTSQESIKERKEIIEAFAKGEKLQALAALKCLDEGVNIPEIKIAFILASTTNPKEYIQRRGRVLRLSDGKRYANIYDFITLPRSLEEAFSLTICEREQVDTLLKNELNRMEEFAEDAENQSQAKNLIDKIKDTYNIKD